MKRFFLVLIMVVFSQEVFAQNPSYQLILSHGVLVSSSAYEFDIYIVRTGEIPFELATLQPIMTFDAGLTTGSVTISVNAGSSELNTPQQPSGMSVSGNELRINPRIPPGTGNGTIIPPSFGKRVGRFHISSSVAFTTKFPGVQWKNSPTNPVTKVNAYVNMLNTNITDTTGHLDYLLKMTTRTPIADRLHQNFPNPFNPTTRIGYDLAADSRVLLTVYNVVGEEVATLEDGIIPAGYHEATFDASKLPSGMYFYRLNAGSSSDVKRLLLLK